MSNITVVVPVHDFNDVTGQYLRNALISVRDQKGLAELPSVVLVYTHMAEQGGVLDVVKEFTSPTGTGTTQPLVINAVKNVGKIDFCSQINFGVKNVSTEYFSILEFDDVFTNIYFKNVVAHIKTYPTVGAFLPFTVEVDAHSGNLIQIVNQTIWSKGYVGENGVLGFLNTKAIGEFSFYTIGGAVLKKSDFEAVGGFKTNIKIAFTYEFILRFLENGNKIYSLPKLGYRHTVNRTGSLFSNYMATMTPKERSFWFETAKKECHFFNDRIIDTSSLVEKTAEITQ